MWELSLIKSQVCHWLTDLIVWQVWEIHLSPIRPHKVTSNICCQIGYVCSWMLVSQHPTIHTHTWRQVWITLWKILYKYNVRWYSLSNHFSLCLSDNMRVIICAAVWSKWNKDETSITHTPTQCLEHSWSVPFLLTARAWQSPSLSVCLCVCVPVCLSFILFKCLCVASERQKDFKTQRGLRRVGAWERVTVIQMLF